MNIKDIADRLSLSTATVSRALRSHTAHMVRPEVRAAIMELADELNYAPHPAARSLRSKKSLLINVLAPRRADIFASEYYGQLLSGILDEALELQVEVRISAFEADADPRLFLQSLREVSLSCGGVFYCATPLNTEQLTVLDMFARPLALLTNTVPMTVPLAEVRLPLLGIDNAQGTYEATRHIIGLGHRRIALVNSRGLHRDGQERTQGFMRALAEAGLPAPEEAYQPYGGYVYTTGVKAWARLRDLPVRPTAVICGNDEIAFGLIESMRKDGVRCPEDISVVGFDDSRLAAFLHPPLTTVRQPAKQIGMSATRLLHAMITAPDERRQNERHITPAELIVRSSTRAL